MEEEVEDLAAPPSDGATAVLALVEGVALDPVANAAKPAGSSQCTSE
jgi:hypothetical protein